MTNPSEEMLRSLLGADKYQEFLSLGGLIDSLYKIEAQWGSGGKKWTYEYKYRKGGKTLCGFYFRENCLGFMVIFGKSEQDAFEKDRENFSETVKSAYDAAPVYHDGRWLMIYPKSGLPRGDMLKLLAIKRRPNMGEAR